MPAPTGRTSSRELKLRIGASPGKPADNFLGSPAEEAAQPIPIEPTEPGFFQNLFGGFICRRSCSNTAGPCGYGGASYKDARPSRYARVPTEFQEDETRGWCGGPGGICFEAENVQKEVNWSFVGPGNGTWQLEQDYLFVGKGMGGWDVVMTKGFYGWRPKKACIGLLAGVTAVVAAGILGWQYLQSQRLPSARGSKQSPVSSSERETFNCTMDNRTWTKEWSVDKRKNCCKRYGRACSRSAYNCSTDEFNWKHAWSTKKKAWCCEHSRVGCKLSSSPRKMTSTGPSRRLVKQRKPYTTAEAGVAAPAEVVTARSDGNQRTEPPFLSLANRLRTVDG